MEFEGKYFPWSVKDTNGNDYKVSTMYMSGVCGWKWQEKADYCCNITESVKEIIPVPTLMNNRGVQVPELETSFISIKNLFQVLGKIVCFVNKKPPTAYKSH